MGNIYFTGNYWYFEWYCEVWKFNTRDEAIMFAEKGKFPFKQRCENPNNRRRNEKRGELTCKN